MRVGILATLRAGLSYFWDRMIWLLGVFLLAWAIATLADVSVRAFYFFATGGKLHTWAAQFVWTSILWTLVDYRVFRDAVLRTGPEPFPSPAFWSRLPMLFAIVVLAVLATFAGEYGEALASSDVRRLAMMDGRTINEQVISSWWFIGLLNAAALTGSILAGVVLVPYLAALANVTLKGTVRAESGLQFARANWLTIFVVGALVSAASEWLAQAYVVMAYAMGYREAAYALVTEWRQIVLPVVLSRLVFLPVVFAITVMPVLMGAAIYRTWAREAAAEETGPVTPPA